MKKTVLAVLLSFSAFLVISDSSARETSRESSGEALFQKNCASCHPNGGNALNPSKTLRSKDLEANNIRTAADIVRKIRNPGPVPTHPQEWAGMKKFDEKELSDADALKIAEYILNTFK